MASLAPVTRLHGRRSGPAASVDLQVTAALIYGRVSKDEMARDSVSLDTQLTLCRRYIAGRPLWEVEGEYQDVMTGTRDDRPDYQRILADVRRLQSQGRNVVVVVSALDRFGRRLMERVRSREELKALGVATHSVREGGEVTDLVANILAVVAQEEVERLSRRVSDVKQHFRAGGWYPVGRCPWGYRLRPATEDERAQGAPKSVLEIDTLCSQYVVEAFQRVASGVSVRRVVAWLASLPPSARCGKILTYAVVRNVMSSPLYLGRFSDEPDAPLARWPAIIDDATFRMVQTRIQGHQKMPRQATNRYLLTGLLRCYRCGSRMAGWQRKGRPAYYRCNGYLRGAEAPDISCVTTVRASLVDDSVVAEVADLLDGLTSNDPDFRKALSAAWERLRQPARGLDSAERSRSLEQQATKVKRRLTRAAELFADGDLDKSGYDNLREKVRDDLDAINAELGRLAAQSPAPVLPPLPDVLQKLSAWSDALTAVDLSAQRDVLEIVIQKVRPVRVGRGTYEADIDWSTQGLALREATAQLRVGTRLIV